MLDPLDRAKLSPPISMTVATIPISIRDNTFLSRIPRWLWAFGIGIVIGAIASRLSSHSRMIGGIRRALEKPYHATQSRLPCNFFYTSGRVLERRENLSVALTHCPMGAYEGLRGTSWRQGCEID